MGKNWKRIFKDFIVIYLIVVFTFLFTLYFYYIGYFNKIEEFKNYAWTYIYPIFLTFIFALVIVYSNIILYKEQRNFEIRKKEYDLIVEKLYEVNKWTVLIRGSEWINFGIQYDDIKQNYYDFIKNVDTNCMIYFPERHKLKAILWNYIDNYRQNPSSNFFPKDISLWLFIFKELILIRLELAKQKLNWDFIDDKNDEKFNKKYFEKVKERFSFLEEEENNDENKKYTGRKYYSHNINGKWYEYFKDTLNIKNEDTKFFK